MGAYVKSEVSGLWNVACGWAQMFGKSRKSSPLIADPNYKDIIYTVLLTSPWGQVIWNVVGRWPLCSPCLHPVWGDLQIEPKIHRKSQRNPRFKMADINSEKIKTAILARRNVELNWIYLIIRLKKSWYNWAFYSAFFYNLKVTVESFDFSAAARALSIVARRFDKVVLTAEWGSQYSVLSFRYQKRRFSPFWICGIPSPDGHAISLLWTAKDSRQIIDWVFLGSYTTPVSVHGRAPTHHLNDLSTTLHKNDEL